GLLLSNPLERPYATGPAGQRAGGHRSAVTSGTSNWTPDSTCVDRGRDNAGGSPRGTLMSPTPDPQLVCPACGGAIPAGARFCPSCGHPVERVPAAAAAAARAGEAAGASRASA